MLKNQWEQWEPDIFINNDLIFQNVYLTTVTLTI